MTECRGKETSKKERGEGGKVKTRATQNLSTYDEAEKRLWSEG